jgi:forkhead box protein J2/3
MSRCPPLFPGEPQPETDPASGQPNWRSLWLKELGHLQQLTQEQEKAGVEQEWYRIMIWRVRAALLPPINPDGSVMGLMIPPLPSHPSEAGPEEAPLNHRPLVEEKDDDTML